MQGDVGVPAILSAGLVIVLGLAPIAILAPEPNSALHPSQTAAPGSMFALGSLTDLDPERHTLILRAPARALTADEVNDLLVFLDAGGRLLFADDSAVGASLLESLAAGVAIGRANLITPSFVETPDRVLVEAAAADLALLAGATLTHPHAVSGGAPVLRVAGPSWVDADRDGRPEPGEPVSDGVVAALQPYGKGAILVVGDPDALSSGSPTFATLLDWAQRDGRSPVYDERHHASSNPFGLASALAGAAGPLWTALCVAAAGSILAVAILRPRREVGGTAAGRRSAPSDDEAYDAISELDPT